MTFREPNYRQCVAIARMALTRRPVEDLELQRFIGPYARNVMTAMLERGYVVRRGEQWELTANGRLIADQLLGDDARRAS